MGKMPLHAASEWRRHILTWFAIALILSCCATSAVTIFVIAPYASADSCFCFLLDAALMLLLLMIVIVHQLFNYLNELQ